MNDTERRYMTVAERLVKKFAGSFNRGEWNRASDLTEANARALADKLRDSQYQVRHVEKDKTGKWEVIFR